MSPNDFDPCFGALTGNPPFPWQTELYRRFIRGEIPASCNLPTGLGKTSVIPIWLIALASIAPRPLVPRRLVYIVNRRTVVDQATDEAKRLQDRLLEPGRYADHADSLARLAAALNGLTGCLQGGPLAVSTLLCRYVPAGKSTFSPLAFAAAMAFSIAVFVKISDGVTSLRSKSISSSPARSPDAAFALFVAGTLDSPIGAIPRNSQTSAIVFAVNCPPHAPAPGHADFSSEASRASFIEPRACAPIAS